MGEKAVLAYSGGLDTSVTIRWLAERGFEVARGRGRRRASRRTSARSSRAASCAGAASVRVVDAVDRYAPRSSSRRAIKANGDVRGEVPDGLGARAPVIAREEVIRVARDVGAS